MIGVFIVAIYLITQMFIVWLIYRKTYNPSVVDVAWSLGIMTAGLIYLSLGALTISHIIVSLLLILWAFRLAGYLFFSRIAKGKVDKRYLELSAATRYSPDVYYLINFQIQACLSFAVSIVFYFISMNEQTGLGWFDLIGIMVVVLGWCIEVVADHQLQEFKKRMPGAVCDVGLWHRSRHPNYVGEWFIWIGFAIIALPAEYGCLGLISPFVMYGIFNYITIPLTEQGSLAARGEQYQQYQQRVAKFFLK